MIKKSELKYRILKYVANNKKPNKGIEIGAALKKLGLEDYIENARDISCEMENEGYIKTYDISNGRKLITHLTLDGKYFIEEYLKGNSNLKDLTNCIENTENLSSVNIQLSTARRYLSSNDDSDYRNAVKEAIGAVESILQIVLDKDKITAGNAVKELSKMTKLHPAFEKGISSLYGYNSDSGGIRHGLKEGDYIPDYTEAKFLVFIYSAFVNYIAESHNLI